MIALQHNWLADHIFSGRQHHFAAARRQLIERRLNLLTEAAQTVLPGVPLPFSPVQRERHTVDLGVAAGVGVEKGIGRAVVNLAGAAGLGGHRGEENQEIERQIGHRRRQNAAEAPPGR